MKNKEVSVILTSYNKPTYLKKAIDSVLSQTYDDVHLIIAEDNSPDLEVYNVINDAVKYNSTKKKITFFNSFVKDEDRFKTARYATQINTAVRTYSSSKYICYLADDDFYYPDMIQEMINSAEEYSYDAVFCAQHVLDEDGNIDGGGLDGRGVRWFSEPLDRGADKLDHNQVMTTRSLFNIVNGWDDHPHTWSGADAYFFDRIEKKGFKFYPIDCTKPLQGKVYRQKSVQWNIVNGYLPNGDTKLGENK